MQDSDRQLSVATEAQRAHEQTIVMLTQQVEVISRDFASAQQCMPLIWFALFRVPLPIALRASLFGRADVFCFRFVLLQRWL